MALHAPRVFTRRALGLDNCAGKTIQYKAVNIVNDLVLKADGAPAPRSWYVLHVKPRTEKRVMLYLERYRCFRYLPLLVKITKV